MGDIRSFTAPPGGAESGIVATGKVERVSTRAWSRHRSIGSAVRAAKEGTVISVAPGVYRERLGALTRTGLSPNVGGGVKINLAGPLRLRVDYRVLKLGSGALDSPAHRVYAGLNLKF